MNGEITESPEPETEGVDPADPFAQVRAAIEQDELERAQSLLEEFQERGAEWYFMQAKVFRAKKWYLESKRCLERAMKESPDCEEYQKEYDELLALGKCGKKKRRTEGESFETGACCFELACTGLCTCLCEGCDGF
ncbi:MAG TPA: hypothetical protein H9670_06230 [Firmicutes bacterium]|nr:hypothetical protein [Bacillota bacterium]